MGDVQPVVDLPVFDWCAEHYCQSCEATVGHGEPQVLAQPSCQEILLELKEISDLLFHRFAIFNSWKTDKTVHVVFHLKRQIQYGSPCHNSLVKLNWIKTCWTIQNFLPYSILARAVFTLALPWPILPQSLTLKPL